MPGKHIAHELHSRQYHTLVDQSRMPDALPLPSINLHDLISMKPESRSRDSGNVHVETIFGTNISYILGVTFTYISSGVKTGDLLILHQHHQSHVRP